MDVTRQNGAETWRYVPATDDVWTGTKNVPGRANRGAFDGLVKTQQPNISSTVKYPGRADQGVELISDAVAHTREPGNRHLQTPYLEP